MCQNACLAGRAQLAGVSALISHGFWGLNSRHKVYLQMALHLLSHLAGSFREGAFGERPELV